MCRLTDADLLELDIGTAGMVEQPDAVAEWHRHDVNQDLVEDARSQAPLDYVTVAIRN